MNKNTVRKIDRLSTERKMLICDICIKVDTCKNAYNGQFFETICYENYKEIKDNFEEDYEVDNY